MKDFRLYDITDFVMDEDFIRWVQEKKHSDEIFWENWLTQNPSKHLLVAEARQIVESVRTEERSIPPSEITNEIHRLLKTVKDQQPARLPPVRLPQRWLPAAAVLALVIATFLLFRPAKEKRSEKFDYPAIAASPSLLEKINTTRSTISIPLPDSSTIELTPGSRISYPPDFRHSDTRDVYLSGEAFFKIARGHGRPFRVFTNEIVTQVLGTSFTIRSFEKDTTIRIMVRTGKVSVYSRATTGNKEPSDAGEPGGIIVTPNQQLVYQRIEQKFQKKLVEQPLFIVPDTLDHNMTYEDAPVDRVFDQLGKYYGINIVYDNELLNKCTVTADIANEPFYHKLDLICRAIGAKYEIIDGQVVIHSNGCQ